MKRSAQVGLLMMGAIGVGTASGTYVSHREQACRADPANQGDPDGRCRHWYSHSGSRGWFYSGNSGTGGTTGRTGGSAVGLTSSSISRGGFGAIGHAMSSGGS